MRAARALFFFLALNASAALPNAHLFEAAENDYQAGRLDSALIRLDQFDQGKDPDGESLDLRGTIKLEQGDLEAAFKFLNAAHKKKPELFAPRLHLADLFLREKKYLEARAIYLKLAGETNIVVSSERLRYGLLVIALATRQDAVAKSALENIKFPTETPAYYFAQAAWEFTHGNEHSAKKWLATASEIFQPPLLSWFARPLFDLGWLKEKPPPPTI